jgi:hypothetical protein
MVDGGPVLLHHGLRRKEKQHSLNPDISPIYLFLPHSFLDVGKEVTREWWIVPEDVRVREGDHRLL